MNERARRRLRERFAQVLARYRTVQALIDEELGAGAGGGGGEREREIEEIENAVELWDAKVLSALSDADLVALGEIFAALRRVADGTYGRCADCEARIDPERLEVVPEASLCIGCATAVEQRVGQRVARHWQKQSA